MEDYFNIGLQQRNCYIHKDAKIQSDPGMADETIGVGTNDKVNMLN